MRTPPWWDRLHWPSVVLMLGILACLGGSVVAFFTMVPVSMVEKLETLPWTTLLTVGVPGIVGALGVIRQAWATPVGSPPKDKLEPKECPLCGHVMEGDDDE